MRNAQAFISYTFAAISGIFFFGGMAVLSGGK